MSLDHLIKTAVTCDVREDMARKSAARLLERALDQVRDPKHCIRDTLTQALRAVSSIQEASHWSSEGLAAAGLVQAKDRALFNQRRAGRHTGNVVFLPTPQPRPEPVISALRQGHDSFFEVAKAIVTPPTAEELAKMREGV